MNHVCTSSSNLFFLLTGRKTKKVLLQTASGLIFVQHFTQGFTRSTPAPATAPSGTLDDRQPRSQPKPVLPIL